jgi:hypothetical protein
VLANKNNKKLMPGMPDFASSVEASSMANNLIPLFLSDHTEEPEQPVIGKAWHSISSRILKTSILVVTAAAIVFAIRLTGNPLVLFTNAPASLVATSVPQDGASQSMPIGQSTADVQALPPTASEAPRGEEIAAASNIANQSHTENPQPAADGLFKEYQAWAAEEDARTQVRPVQKQVRPVQNARGEVGPARNAQAKVAKNPRAQARHEQNVQVRPVQNTQAQAQPVQNAQPTWLLRGLGGHN